MITRYYGSQDFNSQGVVSQGKNRAVIEEFRQGRDHRPVAMLTFEHIDAILAKKASPCMEGVCPLVDSGCPNSNTFVKSASIGGKMDNRLYFTRGFSPWGVEARAGIEPACKDLQSSA